MSEKKIIGIIVIAVVGTFVAVLTLSVYNGEQRLMKLSNGPYRITRHKQILPWQTKRTIRNRTK